MFKTQSSTAHSNQLPRELEDSILSGPVRREDVSALYALRDAYIAQLRAQGFVTAQNLGELDRLGRVKVASELWEICDAQARQALATDEHHQVRSCAAISATRH